MMRFLVPAMLAWEAMGRHHRGSKQNSTKINPAGDFMLDHFITMKGIEELSGLAKDGQIYQSYETFLPKCLERLQSVTKISDTNYKHRDRVEVLREECMATTHFFKDGLTYGEKEKQCDLFAAHINAAADKEKATGSTKGYEDYCQAYYSYSTAGKPMPDVKISDKKDKKTDKKGDKKDDKKKDKKDSKKSEKKPEKKKEEDQEIPMDAAAIKAYSSVIADAAEDSEP